MIAIAIPLVTTSAAGSIGREDEAARHDRFLALLPAIRSHARVAFRHHRDNEAREEAVISAVAHAWAAFVRLCELGRADLIYASPLAAYAVARVREGRSIGGRLNGHDVTSVRCQRRHGVQLESFARVNQIGEWRDIVVEDHRAGPADIAAIRIDFNDWLGSLSRRDRSIAEILATGESTKTAAARIGVSVGRISQLRQKLHAAWLRFQGEAVSTALPAPAYA